MLKAIETIIRDASRMMLSVKAPEVSQKEGHANFVTQTDKDVEEYLQRHLMALIPGSAFIGEEQKNDPLTDGPTWVVDPIDGTHNFIRGLSHSAISVALAKDRRLALAAVYDPYKDEMFLAEAGKGVRLNGEPIRCADTPFEHAVVAFGSSLYVPALAGVTMDALEAYMHSCADVRRSGSAALDLAYVAAGRYDVFFEYSLSPWDYAAGMLLVQEAGGQVELMNLPGDLLDFSKPAAVFSACGSCFKEAREIARRFCPKGAQ